MKLDTLIISRRYDGKLEGSVKVKGSYDHMLQVKLTDEQMVEIIEVAAPAMVDATREALGAIATDARAMLAPPDKAEPMEGEIV